MQLKLSNTPGKFYNLENIQDSIKFFKNSLLKWIQVMDLHKCQELTVILFGLANQL